MELHSAGIQQMCGLSCRHCSWSFLFPTSPFPFFPLLSSCSSYSLSSILGLYLSGISGLSDLFLPSACSQICSRPSAPALPSSPPKRPLIPHLDLCSLSPHSRWSERTPLPLSGWSLQAFSTLLAPMLKLILLALIISFSNVFPSLSWISLFPLLIDYGHFFLRIL